MIERGRNETGDIADPFDLDGGDDIPMRFVDRHDALRASIQDVTIRLSRAKVSLPTKEGDEFGKGDAINHAASKATSTAAC